MGNALLYHYIYEISDYYKATSIDVYGPMNSLLNIIFYGSLNYSFYMPVENYKIITGVVIIIIFVLLLGFFFFLLVAYYNSRKKRFIEEKLLLQARFNEQLLESQLETLEQAFNMTTWVSYSVLHASISAYWTGRKVMIL